MTGTVLYRVEDGVAHITLNRPDAGNGVSLELALDLAAAATDAAHDSSVRAVLVQGAGKNFCVGGDLKTFAAKGPGLSRHLMDVATNLHIAISRLARMDPPVVAAVQGAAAGAGLSLAAACDLVVAAPSARFVVAYTRIGLSPDGSASYSLPRLIGLRRALELTLTNRPLGAEEALDWGLVTAVVPDDELVATASALAAQLAAGAPKALGAAKRLLRESLDNSLETQLELETLALAANADIDGAEGIAAFLEKRPPKFTGG